MNFLFNFVVFALLLLGGGHAHAQKNFDQFCAEGPLNGRNSCTLQPKEITKWKYTHKMSGYIFSSWGEAAEDYYKIWKGDSVGVCQTSYRLGPVNILDRDRFIQSKQIIWESREMYITYGIASNGNCLNVREGYAGSTLYGKREAKCSPWNEDYFTDKDSRGCYTVNPAQGSTSSKFSYTSGFTSKGPKSKGPTCSKDDSPPPTNHFGNPIQASTREKIEIAVDLSVGGPQPLEFRRQYRSHRARDADFWLRDSLVNLHPGDLGSGWIHNHDIHLAYTRMPDDSTGISDQVRIQMSDGSFNYFGRNNGGPYVAKYPLHSLAVTAVGTESGWIFHDREAEAQYLFNAKGRLVQQTSRNGWTQNYSYNPQGKLSTVQNSFGRALQFAYNAAGQLASVTTTDGRSVQFGYVGNLLASVQQVDGTSRQYL